MEHPDDETDSRSSVPKKDDRRRKKQARFKQYQATKGSTGKPRAYEDDMGVPVEADEPVEPEDGLMLSSGSLPSNKVSTESPSGRRRSSREGRGAQRYDDEILSRRIEQAKERSCSQENSTSFEKPDTAVEEKKTSQWDTRSILDHPPEGVERPEALDSSWNPEIPRFDVSETSDDPSAGDTTPVGDGLDMFDTKSWAVSETNFSTFTPAVLATSHESDVSRTNGADMEDSDFDEQWEAVKQQKREEALVDRNGLTDEPTNEENPKIKDDEALLGDDEIRSDVLDSSGPTGDGQLSEEHRRLQQLRIQTYSAEAEADSDSSGGEDVGSDVESLPDIDDDVQYISADSEDEVDMMQVPVPDNTLDEEILSGIQHSSAQDFASFHASMPPVAATVPIVEAAPMMEVENLKLGGDETPMMSNKKKKIMLKIAPPPEEKLRKWEEEKLRPLKHAVARSRPESSNSVQNSPGGSHKSIEGTESGHGPNAMPGQSASPADKARTGLYLDQQRSPAHYDGKIAEKLIMASSAASNKFESMVAREGIKSSISRELLTSRSLDFETEYVEIEDASSNNRPSFFCAPDSIRENIASMTSSSLGISELSVCHGSDDKCSDDGSTFICPPIKASRSTDEMRSTSVSKSHSGELEKMNRGVELFGGAFSPWRNSGLAPVSDKRALSGYEMASIDHVNPLPERTLTERSEPAPKNVDAGAIAVDELLVWLQNDVLGKAGDPDTANLYALSPQQAQRRIAAFLEHDKHLNTLCKYALDKVNSRNREESTTEVSEKTSVPFSVPAGGNNTSSRVLAAHLVSFMALLSNKSGVESPFGDGNPFLLDIVGRSLNRAEEKDADQESSSDARNLQGLVLNYLDGGCIPIVQFLYEVCHYGKELKQNSDAADAKAPLGEYQEMCTRENMESFNPRFQVPGESPSPFETTSEVLPDILSSILDFLGDPVAVCRTKMLNHVCSRAITDNEHVMMRNAVRCGGMSMNVRPAFWMWITLEKCTIHDRKQSTVDATKSGPEVDRCYSDDAEDLSSHAPVASSSLASLEQIGREGKWHNIIQRDVTRAFGNMPPHKTGARLRTDSIVRAMVTWGRSRLLKRGVKGGGAPDSHSSPAPWRADDLDTDGSNESRADKVSDWGGISPVGSFSSVPGGAGEYSYGKQTSGRASISMEANGDKPEKISKSLEELALSGNALTDEMKVDLQNQLGFILHALAAAHEDVGYCQGMDYIVAHLLRVLQDTVRWCAVKGTLPSAIRARPEIPEADTDDQSLSLRIDEAIEGSLVVEETVFRVMDTLFTTYNLRHMFWPELRCLKTCCRVFERLIQIKLPVLADHFEHHDLNVGLFALGWFQTLFLYLPSMPSQTVCHMWDIWLVERSFKIFFRVGTAILFLSQPILLNHELEGMMTYLNTFPDATLLNPDILIACALQIKVTNRMLEEIEQDVTG